MIQLLGYDGDSHPSGLSKDKLEEAEKMQHDLDFNHEVYASDLDDPIIVPRGSDPQAVLAYYNDAKTILHLHDLGHELFPMTFDGEYAFYGPNAQNKKWLMMNVMTKKIMQFSGNKNENKGTPNETAFSKPRVTIVKTWKINESAGWNLKSAWNGIFKIMNIVTKFCFILLFLVLFVSCSNSQKEKHIVYNDTFVVFNSLYPRKTPIFLRYSEMPFSEESDKEQKGFWAELENDSLVQVHTYTSWLNSDSVLKEPMCRAPLGKQFLNLILELEQYSGEVCFENKLSGSKSRSRLIIFGNGKTYYTIYWPGDCENSEFMKLITQIEKFFKEAENYAEK